MKSKINVVQINPPIPSRNFDYCATRDGYEEGDPIGHGATEEEAIQNLIEVEGDSHV